MSVELGTLQIKIREINEKLIEIENKIITIESKNNETIEKEIRKINESINDIIEKKFELIKKYIIEDITNNIVNSIRIEYSKERETKYREVNFMLDNIQNTFLEQIKNLETERTSDYNMFIRVQAEIDTLKNVISEILIQLKEKSLITEFELSKVKLVDKIKWKPISPQEYRERFNKR